MTTNDGYQDITYNPNNYVSNEEYLSYHKKKKKPIKKKRAVAPPTNSKGIKKWE